MYVCMRIYVYIYLVISVVFSRKCFLGSVFCDICTCIQTYTLLLITLVTYDFSYVGYYHFVVYMNIILNISLVLMRK